MWLVAGMGLCLNILESLFNIPELIMDGENA